MTDTAFNALTAKRVGQYLIDAGVLKREDLDEALDRQRRMSRAGFHVLLGTILEEMGAIDRQSLEAIILRQRLDEGSVNLGGEADWATLRSQIDEETVEGNGNGHDAPEAVEAAVSAEAEPAPEVAYEAPAQDLTAEVSQDPAEFLVTEPVLESELAEAQTDSGTFVPADAEADESSEFWGAPGEAFVSPPESDGVELSEDVEASDLVLQGDVEVNTPFESDETSTTAVADAPTWGFDPSTVEETPQEPVGPETVSVAGFDFDRTTNGLDEHAVSRALEQLVQRASSLEEQLNETKDSVAHIETMRRYGEETVRVADTLAAEIREEAETQARALREEAESRATSVRQEAETHASTVREDAETHANTVREEAETQAVTIRDRAQEEARRIVAEARQTHDQIVYRAGERAKQIATEIRQNIEEHRQINERLVQSAERLMETDPESDG